MSEGGSSQQSFRKALGALKDSTKVGLIKVNSSDYKELDVAVVKATSHVEVLPKEKHIRRIFVYVSASSPQVHVEYCIQALTRRLAKTHNWAVALKTLIVVHRAMREVDSTFRDELVRYSRNRGLLLNLSHFKDDSSPNAWDYSAWVRSYALYLEERLECLRILKYDVQKDRSKRFKDLDTQDLLEQLPALQQLLYRLLACKPEGAAQYNFLIQFALEIIAAESVRLYVAITDGTLNLVDKYFEMQRSDAVRALEIYKKGVIQAERLSELFEICRGLDFGRGHKYIKIEQPPASFLRALEEHVKDAPQTLMLPWNENNDDGVVTPKEISPPEPDPETDSKQDTEVEEESDTSAALVTEESDSKQDTKVEALPTTQIVDLLGLDDPIQEASELDEKNALALAIVTPENVLNAGNSSNIECQSTSWELALVTAPSSNGAAVAESKLAGGLDKLTLDSLYDDALARASQNENYQMGNAASPLGTIVPYNQDPFYASNGIEPPTGVQMAAMAEQQQAFIMQQQQPLPVMGHDPTNPFGNPFLEQNSSSHPSQSPYSGLI